MCDGLHSYTASGRMRRATYSDVCGWVIRSWQAVKSSTIINGFKKAGIISDVATQEEETVEHSRTDVETQEEEIVEHSRTELNDDLLALFHSDSEDEDFDGFADA